MNPCSLSTGPLHPHACLLPSLCIYHGFPSGTSRSRSHQFSSRLNFPQRKDFASCSSVGFRVYDTDNNDKRANEATEFIDAKLMDALTQKPGSIKQIVLLTDGVDDRIWRLTWPPLTVIFHVSPVVVNVKLNVPNSCFVRHVYANLKEPTETESWSGNFKNAGFQGDKPSVWVIQGMNYWEIENLPNLLQQIGELAMQGSFLIGHLSTDVMRYLNKDAMMKQIEKSFMGCGFRIRNILHKIDVAHGCHIFYVAEQLHLSNDQINKVLREMELAEELGDEESFEDW